MQKRSVAGAFVMLLLSCLFVTSFGFGLGKGESSQATCKLTVISAHGNPMPSVGVYYYLDGEMVVCGIPLYATENGSDWVCDGYFGSGSVADFGWATNFSFVIHEDSVLRWDWHPRVFPSDNSSTVLAFEEPSYSFKVGDPFNVTVTLQNVSEIYGWQFALIFDPNIIGFKAVSFPPDNIFVDRSPIIGGPYTREVVDGYVCLGSDVGPGCLPFNGSGKSCTFTFVGRSAGNSFLRFRDYHYGTFLLGEQPIEELPFGMTESSAHSVFSKTDVNNDGVVNLKDVGLAVSAFNSVHGSARWNICDDVDCNGRVDMRDIVAIVMDFGKSDPNRQADVRIYLANTNFYVEKGTLKVDVDIGNSGTQTAQLIALYVGTSLSTLAEQTITPVTVAPGEIGRITIDYDWTDGAIYYFRVVPASGLVLDWMSQAPLLMEQIIITNIGFDIAGEEITVTANNTGTTAVTINEVWVNNVKQATTTPDLPQMIQVNTGLNLSVTDYTVIADYSYQVKLMTSKGNQFLYTATAPT